MSSLVIIGTGLAGYNLAKEFRKLNTERSLIIITSDDGASYSKPMLSTGFTKEKTAQDLAMASAEDMAATLNAEIKTYCRVTSVDTDAKLIQTSQGDIAYGDLVFAQGADVFCPPLSGDAQENVFSVNDLQDYDRFRKALEGKKKVLIIGAGLIGCEFANDLSNGGFQVELIDPLERPLQMLLPEQASSALHNGLSSLGVKFHFGVFAEALNKTDQGYRLSLSNNEHLDGEIVLSAVGLRPRIQLAEAAGIEVNKGIKTNNFLETSTTGVYALGDCAEVSGHVLLYVLPLMSAARSLAKTLNGTPTPVVYPAMPVGIKTPVCPIVSAPPTQGQSGSWQEEVDGQNVTSKFVNDEGTLLGFVLTGEACKQKMALQKLLPAVLE